MSNTQQLVVPGPSTIDRVKTVFTVLGGVYVFAVGLLALPYFQTHTLYLNALRLPWSANFDAPERYGLALNKTHNFKIHTSDNETLGAWFILSESIYQSLPSPPSMPRQYIAHALQTQPTILYFHGNAATRAYHTRIQLYSSLGGRLRANILAIDYRGFAESTGSPSEAGLVRDARAAWEWLLSQGAKSENILIMGHSLGTGVSAQLAAELSEEGYQYRGLVLLSPFSSIEEVLKTYNVFGAIPLMKPMSMIPYATNLFSWALVHRFDTLKSVPRIKGQVLIAHAENDFVIPSTHSEVLFNAFLEPLLPSVKLPRNPASLTTDEWSSFTSQISSRKERREEIVATTKIEHFGTVEEFADLTEDRDVVFVKLLEGAHDYVGIQEPLQDIIGRKFGILGMPKMITED